MWRQFYTLRSWPRWPEVATVAQFDAPETNARAGWKRTPRTATEHILSNSQPEVAQGLRLRSTICVSYTRKRRDVHDLPWRRSKVGWQMRARLHPLFRHSNLGRRHGRSCTSRRSRVYETQIVHRKRNPLATSGSELLRMCSVAVRGARFHTARAFVSNASNCTTVANSSHLGRVLKV